MDNQQQNSIQTMHHTSRSNCNNNLITL